MYDPGKNIYTGMSDPSNNILRVILVITLKQKTRDILGITLKKQT